MTKADAGRLGGLKSAKKRRGNSTWGTKAARKRWAGHVKVKPLRSVSVPKILAERPQPTVTVVPPGTDGQTFFAKYPPGLAGVIITTIAEVAAKTTQMLRDVDSIRRQQERIVIVPNELNDPKQRRHLERLKLRSAVYAAR